MKKTLLFLSIILLSLLSNLTVAQNIAREIININKSFYKNDETAMEVTTKYFMDNAVKPNKEETMGIYKTPGNYLYKTGFNESMANKHYKINIDNQKKVMVVAEVTNRAPKNTNPDASSFDKPDFKMSLDTMLNYYKKVSVKSIDATTSEITFSFKQGVYDYITITYNKTAYTVYNYYIKLTKTANTKDGKQHDYAYSISNKYLDKKTLSNKFFSEANYIQVKNREITPTGKYAGYRLINNTKQPS